MKPGRVPLALAASVGIAVSFPTNTSAQSLVLDINPTIVNGSSLGGGTQPRFVPLGSYLYFAADDGIHGSELWRTDGTSVGTTLVKDIEPGVGSSSPRWFVILGGAIVFCATTTSSGSELWRSDGSAAGTLLVKDLQPGSLGTSPTELTQLGTAIYFTAYTTSEGSELRRYDGTIVTLVADIETGSTSSTPHSLTAAGSYLYFAATTGTENCELYRTNASGTTAVRVEDIYPGSKGSNPSALVAFGTKLVFGADDGSAGYEPWISDGTAAGTKLLKDLVPGSESSWPLVITPTTGNRIFLAGRDGTASALWVSDGTRAGTTKVAGPTPLGIEGSMTALGVGVVYVGSTGATGRELCISDGTTAGTRVVKDIAFGTSPSMATGLTTIGNFVWFAANDGIHGVEPYRTDGTSSGTTLVKDVQAGSEGSAAAHFVAFQGRVCFGAGTAASGSEPWISDGTGTGTHMVRDIHDVTRYAAGSWPGPFVSYEGLLYFAADDGVHGREPWVSDGTPAGTHMVTDLAPGAISSNPLYLQVAAKKLWFAGDIGGTGLELCVSDGTPAGTRMVKDITPGLIGSYPGTFVEYHGKVYFTAADSTPGSETGRELWVTDGSSAGTSLVRECNPGPGDGLSGLLPHFVFQNLLWLRAYDPAYGREWWTSDGTSAGTKMLVDFAPGSESGVSEAMVFGDAIYFSGSNGASGLELCKCDGTAAGTVLVKDLNPGTYRSNPRSFVLFGAAFCFLADRPSGGGRVNDPWHSDGTPTGTRIIAALPDYSATSGTGEPDSLTVAGDRLFFALQSNTYGRELWVSDGLSSAGTFMVKDSLPGSGSSIDENYKSILAIGPGRRVLLAQWASSQGLELAVSDGTSTGTYTQLDINPGPESSRPSSFLAHAEGVFFTAYRPDVGIELWHASFRELGSGELERFGHGCPGTGGKVPAIATTGAGPGIGNADFAVTLTQALATRPCALLLAAQRTDIDLGSGCVLYVTANPVALSYFSSGTGTATLNLPVPQDPGLLGGQIWMQWAVLDPNGAFANLVSFSDGLRIRIGRS